MRFFSFCLFLMVVFALARPAAAQPIPPSCDANYYTVMSARAGLSASREMEAAQRIIRKPDSTLEYTCYALNVLNNLAVITGPPPRFLFSDDQNPLSMDEALAGLVLEPMNEYLDDNFWHLYLGGAFPGFGGGPLICDAMMQVWNAAKCRDFDRNFLTLAEMVAVDPRTLPAPCVTARGLYMGAMTAAAFPLPGAPGGMDILDTFQPEMSTCATPPVRTGVMITPASGPAYADAVCIAPGCYYNGAGACVQ